MSYITDESLIIKELTLAGLKDLPEMMRTGEAGSLLIEAETPKFARRLRYLIYCFRRLHSLHQYHLVKVDSLSFRLVKEMGGKSATLRVEEGLPTTASVVKEDVDRGGWDSAKSL